MPTLRHLVLRARFLLPVVGPLPSVPWVGTPALSISTYPAPLQSANSSLPSNPLKAFFTSRPPTHGGSGVARSSQALCPQQLMPQPLKAQANNSSCRCVRPSHPGLYALMPAVLSVRNLPHQSPTPSIPDPWSAPTRGVLCGFQSISALPPQQLPGLGPGRPLFTASLSPASSLSQSQSQHLHHHLAFLRPTSPPSGPHVPVPSLFTVPVPVSPSPPRVPAPHLAVPGIPAVPAPSPPRPRVSGPAQLTP